MYYSGIRIVPVHEFTVGIPTAVPRLAAEVCVGDSSVLLHVSIVLDLVLDLVLVHVYSLQCFAGRG